MLTVGCRGQGTSEFGPEGEEGTGIQWNDPVSRDWVWRTLALGIGNYGGKGRVISQGPCIWGDQQLRGSLPRLCSRWAPRRGVPVIIKRRSQRGGR